MLCVYIDILNQLNLMTPDFSNTLVPHRYQSHLVKAQSLGTKKGLSIGVSLFFVYFFVFTCYAAAFW